MLRVMWTPYSIASNDLLGLMATRMSLQADSFLDFNIAKRARIGLATPSFEEILVQEATNCLPHTGGSYLGNSLRMGHSDHFNHVA